MTYIIGDIHGEISKLKKLINNILKVDKTPSFVFIGDYIDKGEDARSTLNYLLVLDEVHNCSFLLGNHEYMWLNFMNDDVEAKNYLMTYGGKNTIQSFGCANLWETKQQLIDTYKSFFEKMLPSLQYNNFVITHSGIPAAYYQTDLNKIPVKDFLFNRYDFIKNESYYSDGCTVIFGHTGFYTPYYDGYKLGLDTAACFLETQPLTAFNADENYFINSDNSVYLLSTLNMLTCPNIIRNKPWRSI